jgi:hypothetical protein
MEPGQVPTVSRRQRQREFMERAAERAAAKRRARLRDLRQRRDALLAAKDALQGLSEAGGHPDAIRLRPGFVCLAEPRPVREVDPDLDPRRASRAPGYLAETLRRELRTRPPMSRLVRRHGWTMALYLCAIFEAHCLAGVGMDAPERVRHLAVGPPGPWTDPWSRLVADPAMRARNRRVHMTRALAELARYGLVELGPPREHDRFERFRLLSDAGDESAYEVPGEASGLGLPPEFFLNGWHLVLEPRELVVWLMLRHLGRYGRRRDGVWIEDEARRSSYGVTPEVYVSHYELAEFRLVTLHDTVPHRRRGRIAGGQSVELMEGPRLEAYRFQLNRQALNRDAFETVSQALALSPQPPRFRRRRR